MGTCEICAQRQMLEYLCVVVEHRLDLGHIGNTVIILSAKGEALEGGKCRDTDHVKVQATETRKGKRF